MYQAEMERLTQKRKKEEEDARTRLERLELLQSVGVLVFFVFVVTALRLEHTPWSDVSDVVAGVLGFARKGPAWSFMDRIWFSAAG